ncbi:MAG: hypothetical protein ABI467_29130, partial [Kofleriaceae bacterium]
DALTETIDKLRPRLLILDPFVRLHRIDENLAGEVAPLLAYLRIGAGLVRSHSAAATGSAEPRDRRSTAAAVAPDPRVTFVR